MQFPETEIKIEEAGKKELSKWCFIFTQTTYSIAFNKYLGSLNTSCCIHTSYERQMFLVLGKYSRLGETRIFLQSLVQGTLHVTDIQRQLWRNVCFFHQSSLFKQILKSAFYSTVDRYSVILTTKQVSKSDIVLANIFRTYTGHEHLMMFTYYSHMLTGMSVTSRFLLPCCWCSECVLVYEKYAQIEQI